MGTIQPTYQPQVRVADSTAGKPPAPAVSRDNPGITPAAHLFLRERRFASRLVEKEALLDAAQRTGGSDPDTVAEQQKLADAQAHLEQVKLYSPYPPNESPRAALIRRLIKLQEPPGDPSTLDVGVAKIKTDATDAEVDRALAVVKTARADLNGRTDFPADQGAPADRLRRIRVGETTPPGEATSGAVELSQGIRSHFTRHAGLSVSGNARYLRTL